MRLTDVQKRSIFRTLANKSQYATGLEFGLDKYFKSNTGIINTVNKIYQEVKANPAKFAVSEEVVQLVEKGMMDRKSTHSAPLMIKNPGEVEVRDLIIGGNKKAWILLNSKMDYLMKNKGAFKKESIVSLAKLAGIVFDKSQIMSGEATEHIAIRSKIDSGITSEQALEQLVKLREAKGQDD